MDPEAEPRLLPREPVRSFLRSEADPVQGRRIRARQLSWGFLLAMVLVVGVGAVAVDGRTRAEENTAIAGCRHDLSVATEYADGRLGLVSHYLEPPLTSNGRVQRLHLADLMSARAGEVLPGIQRAQRFCRKITLKPWHFSQVERQSTATAYAEALLTLVQTITAQGSTPFRDDGDMQRLREAVGVG